MIDRNRRVRTAFVSFFLGFVAVAGCFVGSAKADARFEQFLARLWPDAERAQVSRAIFDAAFAGLSPDPAVIRNAVSQAEFNQTIGSYVISRVTEQRVAQGRALAAKWKALLDRIEARYGVDRGTIIAIWGAESNFGTGMGG